VVAGVAGAALVEAAPSFFVEAYKSEYHPPPLS
jgi:hypothetical protein